MKTDVIPSPEDIAERLDMSVERVQEIIRIAQDPVSLETPIGEEEDSGLGDFIPDEDAPAPAEAASLVLLKEQINQVLSEPLTDREEKVLQRLESDLRMAVQELLRKWDSSSTLPVKEFVRSKQRLWREAAVIPNQKQQSPGLFGLIRRINVCL